MVAPPLCIVYFDMMCVSGHMPTRKSILESAEFTGLKVIEGLHEFLLGVHQEGTVGGYRLIERCAAEHEVKTSLLALQGDVLTMIAEENEMVGGSCFVLIDRHFTLHHHDAGVVMLREVKLYTASGIEFDIIHLDGGEGVGDTLGALKLSCYHFHLSGIGWKQILRYLGVGDALIVGGSHLVFGGKVYPKLHHLEYATLAAEFLLVILFVEDTGSGCHPLEIALADDAGIATTIVMLHTAMIGECHGLESAVRVYTYTSRSVAWSHLHLRIVVEEEEWAHAVVGHIIAIGKEIVYLKSVAYPVRCGGRQYLLHLFGLHNSVFVCD